MYRVYTNRPIYSLHFYTFVKGLMDKMHLYSIKRDLYYVGLLSLKIFPLFVVGHEPYSQDVLVAG